jgi:hypothetical protein
MKYLALLILSMMFISCASPDRKISSDGPLTREEQIKQQSEFGSGYRN